MDATDLAQLNASMGPNLEDCAFRDLRRHELDYIAMVSTDQNFRSNKARNMREGSRFSVGVPDAIGLSLSTDISGGTKTLIALGLVC